MIIPDGHKRRSDDVVDEVSKKLDKHVGMLARLIIERAIHIESFRTALDNIQ